MWRGKGSSSLGEQGAGEGRRMGDGKQDLYEDRKREQK